MPGNVGKMVEQIRELVKQNGAAGLAGIGRKFRCSDDDGNGQLDQAELMTCFKELGFKFAEEDAKALIEEFDDDGDGMLDYDEFIAACRPPMSLRRRRMVQRIFERMDQEADKNGLLTVADIKGNFQPHGDPRCQKGMKPELVLAEFMSTFDVGDQDGNVDLDAFTKYYQGVSASVDNDDYFELMMRNAWHIAGGQRNETDPGLRVLVTHSNGAQEVVDIFNDLGLDKKNFQDMTKRLSRQGVEDIKKVELYA
jgi:hypothetical protein